MLEVESIFIEFAGEDNEILKLGLNEIKYAKWVSTEVMEINIKMWSR